MYVVFDIGGTHMRIGISAGGSAIDAQRTVPTPANFAQGMATVKKVAAELVHGQAITGAGGAIAGVVDQSRSRLVASPHLPGWVGHSLSEALQPEWGVPLHLHNDAALAGLAEATSGAGKDSSIVAYVTVSTGIGGARLVGGKIDVATYGFEPGQHIIDLDSSACPACRMPGTLEQYVSGSGFKYRFKRDPQDVTDSKAWQEATHWLAVGLHNLTVFWSPEVIVLGGALILKQRISLPTLQVEFARISRVFPTLPLLKLAELGADNGLRGALVYIQAA